MRGAGADLTAFHEGGAHAPLLERVSGADTDHPTADDQDIAIPSHRLEPHCAQARIDHLERMICIVAAEG